MQGPSSFVILQAQQIIISTNGVSGNGLFVYNPAPAAGNLIASIVAAAGTDPYNNPVRAGIFNYRGTALIGLVGAALLAGFTSDFGLGGLNMAAAGDMVLSSDAVNSTDIAAGLRLISKSASPTGSPFLNAIDQFLVSSGNASPSTTALLEVQGAIQTTNLNTIEANGNLQSDLGDIIAVAGNVNITTAGKGVMRTGETWHIIGAASQPPFLNSFSAGGTAPRFQLEAIGAGRVRLSGAVNTGATNVASTPMFNLPAGYRPSRTLNFVTQNNITAYTLGSGSVEVHTNGDVVCVPASTAGKFVLIDGICFELD